MGGGVSQVALTELVLGHHRLRDAGSSAAKLVLSCDPENVLLPFDQLGDRAAGSLQCGRYCDPAHLYISIVLLLQDVVQDLAATIIYRGLPVADHRRIPDVVEGEVNGRARFVFGEKIGLNSIFFEQHSGFN